MYETVGKSELEWKKLEDVPINIQATLNNRPWIYIEEDLIPNKDPSDNESKDLRKRQKYIKRCKKVVRKRRRNEYLTSLRKTHHLKHNKREPKIEVAEVVLIKSNEQNKVQWKRGILTEVLS